MHLFYDFSNLFRHDGLGKSLLDLQRGEFMKRVLFVLVSLFSFVYAFALVNINTASKRELESLPNIGSVKAKAIEDYRREHGNFKKAEDIIKVKGIGSATYEKLKNHITVGNTVKTPAASSSHRKKYAVPATSSVK